MTTATANYIMHGSRLRSLFFDASIRREAAILSCTCVAASAAYPRSQWFHALRVGRSGKVFEPASGSFDVTVAPSEDVQASVDRCPPGGCVLLLPGTHAGPLVLAADREVHVFGRGLVTLWTSAGHALVSRAATSTLDGLIVRQCPTLDSVTVAPDGPTSTINDRDEGAPVPGAAGAPALEEAFEDLEEPPEEFGVCIEAGRLRLQACDISSASSTSLFIHGGADPVVSSCKCVRARGGLEVSCIFLPSLEIWAPVGASSPGHTSTLQPA